MAAVQGPGPSGLPRPTQQQTCGEPPGGRCRCAHRGPPPPRPRRSLCLQRGHPHGSAAHARPSAASGALVHPPKVTGGSGRSASSSRRAESPAESPAERGAALGWAVCLWGVPGFGAWVCALLRRGLCSQRRRGSDRTANGVVSSTSCPRGLIGPSAVGGVGCAVPWVSAPSCVRRLGAGPGVGPSRALKSQPIDHGAKVGRAGSAGWAEASNR